MKENEDNNIIDFETIRKNRLALAGAEPPDPYGPNWLKNKPIGSVFLVRSKRTTDFNLGLFTILDKTERSVLLVSNISMPPIRTYVDPIAFCNNFSLYEDLGSIVSEETEEKNNIDNEQ